MNLSKELRKKYKKRNISARKNDVVRIMRGKFKGKKGKILNIELKKSKVTVEGIQVKKQDGSKANIKINPSKLQIIELSLEDKKRKIQKSEKDKEEIIKEIKSKKTKE